MKDEKGLFLRVPEKTYEKLKIYCIQKKISMREAILKWIEGLKL